MCLLLIVTPIVYINSFPSPLSSRTESFLPMGSLLLTNLTSHSTSFITSGTGSRIHLWYTPKQLSPSLRLFYLTTEKKLFLSSRISQLIGISLWSIVSKSLPPPQDGQLEKFIECKTVSCQWSSRPRYSHAWPIPEISVLFEHIYSPESPQPVWDGFLTLTAKQVLTFTLWFHSPLLSTFSTMNLYHM